MHIYGHRCAVAASDVVSSLLKDNQLLRVSTTFLGGGAGLRVSGFKKKHKHTKLFKSNLTVLKV